jgi:hypothetical protein
MTLAVDSFGNVLQSVAIGYGRRHPDSSLSPSDRDEQLRLRITFTSNSYAALAPQDDRHRTPLPAESRTFELLRCAPQLSLPDITHLFRFDEMQSLANRAGDGGHDLPYEDLDAAGATLPEPYRRLIERVRTLYRRDDLGAALPLGRIESLALPFETYTQAFTPGLLAQVYGSRIGGAALAAALRDEGGYLDLDGDSAQ